MVANAFRDTVTPELSPGFSTDTMNFTKCPKLAQTSATFRSFYTRDKLDLSDPIYTDSRTAADSSLEVRMMEKFPAWMEENKSKKRWDGSKDTTLHGTSVAFAEDI